MIESICQTLKSQLDDRSGRLEQGNYTPWSVGVDSSMKL